MTATIVPRVNTGSTGQPGSTLWWRNTRREMLAAECGRMLAWIEGGAILAPLFLAHARNETGGGRYEDNFNIGNTRAWPSQNVVAFERGGRLWRAYPSLRDGVRGYLSTFLLRDDRRRATLAYIRHRDPARWYREAIIQSGYDDHPRAAEAIPGFVRIWHQEMNLSR